MRCTLWILKRIIVGKNAQLANAAKDNPELQKIIPYGVPWSFPRQPGYIIPLNHFIPIALYKIVETG